MEQSTYHADITVNTTPGKAFENINNVSKWWTANCEGNSKSAGDVFTTRFGDTFVTFKIVEVVPNKKVLWHVTDCNLHWLKDKKEWKDTEMNFEISVKGHATQINFTHLGLVPQIECYNDCKKGWDFYIKKSLYKLITTGQGLPETPKAAR